MEALGRIFNVVTIADDVYVNLRDYSGVTFICHNAAGDTWTLTEATTAAGGSAAVLATITRYHTTATVGALWVKNTQTAASTVVSTASQDVVCIEVDGTELSDGFDFVKLTSTGAGLVTAILRDPAEQRAPANLASVIA